MTRNTFNYLLLRAYLYGISLQSNAARQYDQEISALASIGLITTKEAPHEYGRIWRITEEGMGLLRDEGLL